MKHESRQTPRVITIDPRKPLKNNHATTETETSISEFTAQLNDLGHIRHYIENHAATESESFLGILRQLDAGAKCLGHSAKKRVRACGFIAIRMSARAIQEIH